MTTPPTLPAEAMEVLALRLPCALTVAAELLALARARREEQRAQEKKAAA